MVAPSLPHNPPIYSARFEPMGAQWAGLNGQPWRLGNGNPVRKVWEINLRARYTRCGEGVGDATLTQASPVAR